MCKAQGLPCGSGRVLGPSIISSAFPCLSLHTPGHKPTACLAVRRPSAGRLFGSVQCFYWFPLHSQDFFNLSCSLQSSGGASITGSGLWLGGSSGATMGSTPKSDLWGGVCGIPGGLLRSGGHELSLQVSSAGDSGREGSGCEKGGQSTEVPGC